MNTVLSILKALGVLFGAIPDAASVKGQLNAAEILKVILTFVVSHTAVLSFLGPWQAVAVAAAGAILQAVNLLNHGTAPTPTA